MVEKRNIWNGDCRVWQAALDSYPQVIVEQSNDKLTNLDSWYSNSLPGVIRERQPPCVYADELQGVAAWKMTRGVWRERNRQLIGTNDPAKVEQVSREAFEAAPDPRKPIALLSGLAGVGPATASAIMAAYAPDTYPFFDELVAEQVPGLGPVAFTLKYYLAYSEALREQAQELSAECGRAWTVQDVAQALWAASGGKAANPQLR